MSRRLAPLALVSLLCCGAPDRPATPPTPSPPAAEPPPTAATADGAPDAAATAEEAPDAASPLYPDTPPGRQLAWLLSERQHETENDARGHFSSRVQGLLLPQGIAQGVRALGLSGAETVRIEPPGRADLLTAIVRDANGREQRVSVLVEASDPHGIDEILLTEVFGAARHLGVGRQGLKQARREVEPDRDSAREAKIVEGRCEPTRRGREPRQEMAIGTVRPYASSLDALTTKVSPGAKPVDLNWPWPSTELLGGMRAFRFRSPSRNTQNRPSTTPINAITAADRLLELVGEGERGARGRGFGALGAGAAPLRSST